jgi:uncharacterized damage-inducible protein DinB
MNAQAILAHQLHVTHVVATQNLEGMSARESLVQPPWGGNCANWILGHLVSVHNELARVLGVAPVWEAPELERAGPEPIRGAEGAIDWQEMVTRFAESEARIGAALEALTDEEMAEVISTPAFGDTPRGILLATILFHQAYHAGQLATARRLAGLPGAIRIPGTE